MAERVQKAGEGDFLRRGEAALQILKGADVERRRRGVPRALARPSELPQRLPRPQSDTRRGSLQLRVPKLRQDSYVPPFLEPRKMTEKPLVAVIQEIWIGIDRAVDPRALRRVLTPAQW